MPTYRTRIINRDFDASSDSEHPDLDTARAQALAAALDIGVEEIRAGKPFFAAEVIVECDGRTADRLMVAIGTSPLQ